MNLKSIMLSEGSQSEKNCTLYDSIYKTAKKQKLLRQRIDQWIPGLKLITEI